MKYTREALIRSTFQIHHFRRFLVAAHAAGLDVIPMKGGYVSALEADQNAPPVLMGDIDFLIRPEQYALGIELLESLGFVDRNPGGHPAWRAHELGFVLEITPGNHILLEPHRALFDPRRFPIDMGPVWDRSQGFTYDGIPCRRLAPEDHFVFIALHSVLHRLGNTKRAVRQIETIARHDGLDPSRLAVRAKQWKAVRATALFAKMVVDEEGEFQDAAGRALFELNLPDRTDALLDDVIDAVNKRRLRHMNYRLQAAIQWPILFDDPKTFFRFATNHALFRPAR